MPRKYSKEFSLDNVKMTRTIGYVYYFSVDYDGIAVDDILDIMFGFIKICFFTGMMFLVAIH